MRIEFLTKNNGRGPLADVELHFDEGDLEGLKITGLSLWPSRDGGGEVFVTFPSRKYETKEGATKYFDYIQGDKGAVNALKGQIIEAYQRGR